MVAWWRRENEKTAAVGTPESLDHQVRPISLERVKDSLRRLEIRFLTDEEGYLIALWEGHSVLFGVEGDDSNVLVMRARADALLPADWEARGYAAVNEWNRSRRFLKTFIGAPTDTGGLPVYGEMQVYLGPGIHDALLDDLVDCVASVAGAWTEWLTGEGALL